MTIDYQEFLQRKSQLGGDIGFEPTFLPDYLFDFQKALVEWAVRKGRAAIFSDCGTGKTPMQLVWAENVMRKGNKPVLIITPLAVSHQTILEAEKFGIEAHRSQDGKFVNGIVVTNYDRLHYFNPGDFCGLVCDESSILKSFEGSTRKAITDFAHKIPYRLLCTATASPNDYIELGTSSEALGHLGHIDMLNRFFKNQQNNSAMRRFYGKAAAWRFKGHAETPFWRWVCSWARALRRPSDLGFDDDGFILPTLRQTVHTIEAKRLRSGLLFELPAVGLREEREESRYTIQERCEKAAELASRADASALIWCNLNSEGNLLERLICDGVQIAGSDSTERKEEKFLSFIRGDSRVLITKPKIGAWGLNFQHCSNIVMFPSHSFEQYYQGVRRCWRFGQKKPVHVNIITTKGGENTMLNLARKAKAADGMFSRLVAEMNRELKIRRASKFIDKEEIPSWL